MQFLKPTTDIVFKKLFGDQRRAELTISFLNGVLERKSGELITQITINEDANIPEIADQKLSFVDVRCTDQVGKQYIVEMQVVLQEAFLERAQYYSAVGLYKQLKSKQKYHELAPVIFIGVLDFNLFKHHDRYLTHHVISDVETGEQSLRHLEYHFLELTKFDKTIEQVNTLSEKWAWFIKMADEMGEIPRQMKGDEAFREAFHVLERSGWSEADFDAYERALDVERSDYGKVAGAVAEAVEQRMAETARKMFAKGLSIEIIAEVTGLLPEEIKKLR